MGEIVKLHGRPIPLENDELIENLARFGDGTLTKEAVKSRHHLDDTDWVAMATDEEFVRRVEERKIQRIRSGATKRERA